MAESRAEKLRCPAGEATRGTLSLNRLDVRCRISGLLQRAEGSPCCGAYTSCGIWKGEKDRLAANRRAQRADRMIHAGTGEWT